ncbi:carbon-nitrogen hydrolase family protein [Roseococcus sp. SYP-B2431]|uniref:carbon-nitrogen hydrolase family protein n=1 Tax=Roseococcus sp. SYP-B2431 TaxID=2496640 RepID=UPI001F0F18E1|nr:carbon-nitrogen hydrolase family protein [Roseococcus sp. SYP-B2431]
MTTLTLAALAWPVEPTAGIAAYAAKLDRWVGAAKAGGADLVVMPEYACVELGAALAGRNAPDAATELRAMVEASDGVLAAMRGAALRHGIWLQPGTLPMRAGDAVVNRAPLVAPDGRIAMQDKCRMTRFETEHWGVSSGAPPKVFDTPWGRIGIAVCYDAEFPDMVRAQVEAGAWLILVPTCTDTDHGFSRVRIGARARAMENQCFVAVAPTLGGFEGSVALDENHGAAGIYGPVDRGFPADGIIAELAHDTPGLLFATLDPTRLEAVRADGAVRNHRDWPAAPVPRSTPAVFA